MRKCADLPAVASPVWQVPIGGGYRGGEGEKTAMKNKSFSCALKLGTVMHKRHREKLLECYPALTTQDLLILRYLLTRRFATDKSCIPFSAEEVSRVIHQDPNAKRDHNICVKTVVDGLCKATGMIITLSTPSYQAHLAYDVTELVMPRDMAQILYDSGDDLLKREGVVDIASGKIISEKHLRVYHNEQKERLKEKNGQTHYPWQPAFLEFLNERLTPAHFPLHHAEIIDARRFARDNMAGHKRHAAEAAIDWIELFPQPLYKGVNLSERVFTERHSLATIAKPLKRLLLPNSIDIDYQNCQAAVFAFLCDCPLLEEILDSRESLWTVIMHDLGVDAYNKEARSAIKKGTYSLIFGAYPRNLFRDSTAEDFPDEWRKQYKALPVVREMLKARNKLLSRIERDGGMMNALGIWEYVQPLDDGTMRGPRKVLATIAQSYEQALMKPLREDAMESIDKEHGYTLLAYQHDGATIRLRHKGDERAVINSLREMANARAVELGIKTRLTFEWADGHEPAY